MRTLGHASAGLIVWAVLFALLYGLHGLGCAGGWTARTVGGVSLFRAVLVAAWLAGIAANAAVLLWTLRAPRSPFVRRIALVSAVAGLAATLFGGAPVLLYPACL